MNIIHHSRQVLMALSFALGSVALAWGAPPRIPLPYPDMTQGAYSKAQPGNLSRGAGTDAKIAPELQVLVAQYTVARGPASPAHYSPEQLASRFGITGHAINPRIGIVLQLKPESDVTTLSPLGATVFYQTGSTAYASAPVQALTALARSPLVVHISPTKAAHTPQKPSTRRLSFPLRDAAALPLDFDHQGLTGKGVIVGIVDSGIDWKHPDFVKPDGSTRILALWDMTDDSWTKSHGKIGSKPPIDADGTAIGTLYTQAQINAALTGQGTVASQDLEGHGTACAGTAAGNATDTAYQGVAPAADLLIVRAGQHDEINNIYYLGTRWIAQTAQALGEPVVISQSFGSQDSPHDGSSSEEAALNALAGQGKPGIILCASAGNDGRDSFHAGGRFGPKQAGQADIESEPVELFVSKDTELDAYFHHGDEWGLALVGLDKFLVTSGGKPDVLFLTDTDGDTRGKFKAPPSEPSDPSAFFGTVKSETTDDGKQDHLSVPLPAGKYLVVGFGASEKVGDGGFDLYLPFPQDASFGQGTDKRYMVSTPGNADNVITVGAYNVRRSWTGQDGKSTNYNLVLGDFSDYSSPGYRRGGLVKPEILAPGTYMLSPLAAGSALGKDGDGKPDPTMILPDGKHLAWAGTSAASPYTAGVIALMLEKNPTLDESQVRDILTKSATQDTLTGAVPNSQWGYGKLNPAAALAATPAKS